GVHAPAKTFPTHFSSWAQRVLWRLSTEQTVFLLGLALACAATAFVAAVAAERRSVGAVLKVAAAYVTAFGALGLWLLLSRYFHSRPMLMVGLALAAVLCVMMLLPWRRTVAALTLSAAVASMALQPLGNRPGLEYTQRMGGEVGARHKTATVSTSVYTLRADVFLDYFCSEPTLECPAPRFGGGITALADGYVVADGDGQMYFARQVAPGKLDHRVLAYRVPVNAKEFLGGRLDAGGALFRVTDVLAVDSDGLIDLYASHHIWHADRQCFALRVSKLRGTVAQLLSQNAELSWTTVFETQPCLPVLEPLPGSVHKGRLFAGDESGGRMAMLSSTTMLLTVGDHLFNGHDREQMLSQDPATHYGKTLSIDLGTGSAQVFTLGHRNPQGLVVSSDGTVWLTEHGPRGGDELNRLVAGRNYGWPLVTYGTDYGSDRWPLNAKQGEHEGFERPVHAWVPSIATGNLLAVQHELFGEWQGDLLVGAYSKNLWRMRIRDGRVAFAEPIDVRALGSGRIRDLIEDGNGRLVLWIDGGTLAFLTPQGSAQRAAARVASSVARPEDLFERWCASCHAIAAGSGGGSGPVLNAILGRQVAGLPGFAYSSALRNKGGTWTEANLDAYLASPQTFAPGTTMAFAGISEPQERRLVIEYLKSLK
nr:PQQ-dependent sugar dehydrogenase [Burkholderiaceae bacterium]